MLLMYIKHSLKETCFHLPIKQRFLIGQLTNVFLNWQIKTTTFCLNWQIKTNTNTFFNWLPVTKKHVFFVNWPITHVS